MMNRNEELMIARGQEKTWKDIFTKSNDLKKISSTQVGKKLLMDEAMRILPEVVAWIETKCSNTHRVIYKAYFENPEDPENQENLLTKIAETMLLLSGNIEEGTGGGKRHKKIETLQRHLMPELEFDLIWRFVEVVVDVSTFFMLDKELCKVGKSYRWRVSYKSTLSETILNKLTAEAASAFYPLPMVVKPVDWNYCEQFGLAGGYQEYQYQMVRMSGMAIDYSLYSDKIFKSVNYIQSTAWVVNKDVLPILKRDLKKPVKKDYIHSAFPDMSKCYWDIKNLEESDFTDMQQVEIVNHREEVRSAIELYNAEATDFESAIGKWRATKLAVSIAEQYQHEDEIYFPHSYDFRGRVYPLPIGLSPQGSDAVKSLLLYKNTEPLTELGIKWNWAYLASLYGDDKLPFEERVERGKDLIDAVYSDADEPYQFLSHQIELNKWVDDNSYVPNTRIHLDACNSGSQFTSAITGDSAGCIATNVIPTFDESGGQVRQDAYLLVADRALSLTNDLIKSADEESKPTLVFFKELLEEHGRKLCKTPTMVSNYGGTAQGRSEILYQLFRELGCDRKWITKKNSSKLSKIIGDSIQGVLNGGKAFEIYVQKMCNLISRSNKGVHWSTADGFHVIHKKNKELKLKQISCNLPNSRGKITLSKRSFSKDVSPGKMRSAISPNYIHALDAELLRRVALKMGAAGITNSDWIHDSYGCHPNHVDLMLDITKDEFNKLVKRRPLLTLDKELRSQMDEEDASILKAADKVRIPTFRGFRAEKGIDSLLKSDWFFS